MARRREWTGETLAAGVREGDRRALARAITLVENGDPLAYELVREVYPETGSRVRRRDHRAARRRQVEPDRRARPPDPRGRTRRVGVDLRRPVEPVHAGRAPRRPHPPVRALPRPGRLHPLDGHARPPRRPRRGDASGPARPGRGRKGRDLRGDGRHRPERGRGDRDRRHRPARAHARLGRLDPGAEGGDHGDPGRDRDQQEGPPGGEDDAERGALDPHARQGPRRGGRRSCSPRRRPTRASPKLWEKVEEHRAHPRGGAAARGAPPPEPRGRGVRGRLGPGEDASRAAPSRTIPSCGASWTRCSSENWTP